MKTAFFSLKCFTISLFALLACELRAEVRMPATFADNMLLQRNQRLPVYGQAKPGEKITVEFAEQRKETTAGKDGKWRLFLAPLFASTTPAEMKISGENSIVIKNVLVGDLWLASGQSNMGMQVSGVNNAAAEIKAANYDGIRFFMVKRDLASSPRSEPQGEWKLCIPENARSFSAVAYFYARELHNRHGVPIGIINSAIGSSPCEAWVAADVLRANKALPQPPTIPPEEYTDWKTYKAVRMKVYHDAAAKDPGIREECLAWATPDYNASDWKEMTVPGSIEKRGLKIDGAIWFRSEVQLPESWVGKNASLYLGFIGQNSIAYVNGTEVGRKKNNGGTWVSRNHKIPGKLLRAGRNVIAVRIFNEIGQGGFYPNYPAPLKLSQGKNQILLPKTWKYKVELACEPGKLARNLSEGYYVPTGFYNAMIAPYASTPLRGFIWYQGESNSGRWKQHNILFPTLIRSWRALWNDDTLPFYFVQLASYRKRETKPGNGGWAFMRESQASALALPRTGMAVTIDIGDATNVHPKNKQDVGKRLALWASRDCYGESDIAVSGPLYASSSIEGKRIRIHFNHVYGGLEAKGGVLKGFAIAGADEKFVWADAKIEGETVVVWNDSIPSPVHVQYAWANNPECTLFNTAGLPASGFQANAKTPPGEPKPAPLQLYISPEGKDGWSGKLPAPNAEKTDGPLATLDAARDLLRKLRAENKLPAGGARVLLREGRYALTQPFSLAKEDAGTATAPIVYGRYGKEKVRLSGGRAVTGFRKAEDPSILQRLVPEARGKVLVADLKKLGITDYGILPNKGERGAGSPAEFYVNGQAMTLARWPNKGYVRIAGAPEGAKEPVFAYAEDRPARWVDEKDPRGVGFWRHDWAAAHIRFTSIDPQERLIHTPDPVRHYGFRKGGRYFAYNLLCELDTPGEWYLDREAGKLYFWAPMPLENVTCELSTTDGLLRVKEASHTTFEGWILEACRGNAIQITNCDSTGITTCEIRNIGGRAISISNGRNCHVEGSDIHHTGRGGVSANGGDRPTLTPAGHRIENCHIYEYSRWQKTYAGAVQISGVGQHVAHNLIHDGSHVAVLFSGNDHLFEFNEIHSICYESGEMGAFYCGRDWTLRGNVIRYNFVHDIYNPCPQRNRGIMLDDAASGITMTGNVFARVAEGIVFAGRSNIVENNIFYDCHPGVYVWCRSLDRVEKRARNVDTLLRRLAAQPYKTPPWSTRYPNLVNILNDQPSAPKYSRVVHNIFAGGGKGCHTDKLAIGIVPVENNLEGVDPRFVDAANDDYTLRPDSPAFKIGFKPIPFKEIGLEKTPTRYSWPVTHAVRDVPRNLVYVRPPRKELGPKPQYLVPKRTVAVKLDGTLEKDEWGGLDTGKAMELKYSYNGDILAHRSRAWLSYDADALYIGIQNDITGRKAPILGKEWGKNESLEVAIRNDALGKKAPILLLRGFAAGGFESSDEAGAPKNLVEQLGKGTQYAAKMTGKTRWEAEWRIPFAALGVDSAKQAVLSFNLTIRKTGSPCWLMWRPTDGNSFLVDRVGTLKLGK